MTLPASATHGAPRRVGNTKGTGQRVKSKQLSSFSDGAVSRPKIVFRHDMRSSKETDFRNSTAERTICFCASGTMKTEKVWHVRRLFGSAAARRRFCEAELDCVGLPDVRRVHDEIVGDFHAVRTNSHHRPIKRLLCRALEPSRRTLFILLRPLCQAMPDRVGMHVIQSRKIGSKVGQMEIPVLKPDAAAGGFIFLVDRFCSNSVQVTDEFRQRLRRVGGNCNEVVVVGEDGPRLQFPVLGSGEIQECLAQVSQPFGGAEQRLLLIRRRRDHVRARLIEVMCGAVRPVRHAREFTAASEGKQSGGGQGFRSGCFGRDESVSSGDGQRQSGVEPPHSQKRRGRGGWITPRRSLRAG